VGCIHHQGWNIRRVQFVEQRWITDDEFRRSLGDDALGKARVACGIERHDEDAAQHTAVKGSDPRSGVLAPEEDPIAGGDAAACVFCCVARAELG